MFESSFLLWLKTLLVNIILPLIPGILFIWICFGKKLSGMLLYILSWFVGVGVVAFSLFNLQFFHFGIGIGEYLFVLWLLAALFIGKILYKRLSFKQYFSTLRIKNIFSDIQHSFRQLSKVERIFTMIVSIFWLSFLIVTFIQTTYFPTYADDSFGNWNRPTYNIYYDGWIKIFWDESEILGRWRLGYPVYVPLYKALLSDVVGGFDDIYINMWQRLVFLWILMFIFIVTFSTTKNIFYSVLPIGLVLALPLVFFHAGEWYMELASATYSLLTIWAFWKFLEDKNYEYISLWLLLWFMLSYIKNDGFVVYLPGILIALVVILLSSKTLVATLKWFFKNTYNLLLSGFFFVFFFLPFLIIKNYYHLGFNQAAWIESWVGISSTIHREIFKVFPWIFMKMDNYNVVLILILCIFWWAIFKRKQLSWASKFLLYAPLAIFLVLLLVFLLTDNYRFVMDQTTVNRVFTIAFILLFSFIWLLLGKKWQDS